LGQVFYIPILKQNKPSLLNIKTGRFYTPKNLTSPFYPLSILPGFLKKYFRQKFKPNDTFNIEAWNKIFMLENPGVMEYNNQYFNSIKNPPGMGNELSKQLSLKLWFSKMQH
jgi:hypothetical protein